MLLNDTTFIFRISMIEKLIYLFYLELIIMLRNKLNIMKNNKKLELRRGTGYFTLLISFYF
jgi:hypothetical protein